LYDHEPRLTKANYVEALVLLQGAKYHILESGHKFMICHALHGSVSQK